MKVLEQKIMGLETEGMSPRNLKEMEGNLRLQGSGRRTCFLFLALNVFYYFLKEKERGKIKIWGNYPQRWKVSGLVGDGLAILSACFLFVF